MGIGNMVKMASNDANLIEIDLKKRFPGQQIAKRAIRVFYQLPHNRAVNMWEILSIKGFTVTNRDVFVPIEPAPSADQKKN